MGDVVHALTAVREAKCQRPELQFDWLIEESFVDIAAIAQRSGDVNEVIPIGFRKWRKQKPFGPFFNTHIRQLKRQLRKNCYDLVLDAQGLLKSVFLARLAKAPIYGFDRHSARERLASLFYQKTFTVAKDLHAIERQRRLFSQAFDYPLPALPPTLDSTKNRPTNDAKPSVLFFHGTTWDNKRYPTDNWRALAARLVDAGYQVYLPHHGGDELRVATAIANGLNGVNILPEQRLNELLPLLQSATAVVSVDTGLAHLAVYFGTPTVMLFGPTRPELTGGIGKHTVNLQGKADDSACMRRETYADAHTFSNSMSAITVEEIDAALRRLQ